MIRAPHSQGSDAGRPIRSNDLPEIGQPSPRDPDGTRSARRRGHCAELADTTELTIRSKC
jgi:hypothetical protein